MVRELGELRWILSKKHGAEAGRGERYLCLLSLSRRSNSTERRRIAAIGFSPLKGESKRDAFYRNKSRDGRNYHEFNKSFPCNCCLPDRSRQRDRIGSSRLLSGSSTRNRDGSGITDGSYGQHHWRREWHDQRRGYKFDELASRGHWNDGYFGYEI